MEPSLELSQKHKVLRILFGCVALLLPFLVIWQLMLIVLAVTIIFAFIAPKNRISTHICFAVLILVILSWLLNFPIYLLGASVAIFTFSGVTRDLITQRKTVQGSVAFLLLGVIFAFCIGSWVIALTDVTLSSPYQFMFFLAVIGAITGAMLDSIPHSNENLTVSLGSAMAMWLFAGFGYWVSPGYLMLVLALMLEIGYISYRVNVADITGALSGVLWGVLIIIFEDMGWFAVLFGFFVLGGAFTRYKYEYKQSLGIAEAEGGARGYRNVFGNGLVALILAVAGGVFGDPIFLVGYLGAIATATGDTLASEIGETSEYQPVSIITFKRVRTGTNGAISVLGEISAIAGSAAIGILAIFLGMAGLQVASITILGGFIGTNVDSLLGATLENRGYLTNSSVNLFATAAGALVSAGLYYVLV
ncbi:MAG: TIGR00297 family protein [Methanocellales archaeon]|nr:TIGR00297 family protein [Methanocellales archaeon]MDD3291780.1 TIGR00297 family protein [Methanocellales archaeon]MDD5235130.1 TIGR00297 family protein [Methanocellales archaeon]MDD5485268.1 TIGR00297 family protein [Methanocellales archaeon]